MDNQTAQRVKDLLSRSQRIAIAVGKNPSIDDMGAALALYLTLQAAGKTASVVAPAEPIVEVSNLVGINKVKTHLEGDGADLVVSFPYKEGEIEKVSYTIENGFLNIVVKAGDQGLNFTEQDVKYSRGGGGHVDTLFVVGVPRISDIQSIFTPDALKDVTIVNIDNKQDNQGYGDVVLVSTRFSSVSEQMAQLLLDMNMDPDIDAAQNLLDGIAFSTESFQSPRTSYLAFEMAGELMRLGAIRSMRPAAPQSQLQAQPARPAQQPQQQAGFQQPMRQNQPRPQQPQQPQQQHGQDRRQPMDQRRQQPNQPQPQQRQAQQQPQSQFGNQPHHNQPQRPVQQQPQAQSGQFNQPQPQVQQQPVQSAPFVQPQQQQPVQQQVTQSQPPVQPQPAQNQPVEDLNPPSDWLTPKVYKGSSNI